MKVYNWQGFRPECPPAPNGSRQTQEVVAAKSKAALMRLTGFSRHFVDEWVAEGASEATEALTLADPGVIFWQPINTQWDMRDVYVRDGEAWVEAA